VKTLAKEKRKFSNFDGRGGKRGRSQDILKMDRGRDIAWMWWKTRFGGICREEEGKKGGGGCGWWGRQFLQSLMGGRGRNLGDDEKLERGRKGGEEVRILYKSQGKVKAFGIAALQ